MSVANDVCGLVRQTLLEHRGVLQARRELVSARRAQSFSDIDEQLRHLVYRGFVRLTPREQLAALPGLTCPVSDVLPRLYRLDL